MNRFFTATEANSIRAAWDALLEFVEKQGGMLRNVDAAEMDRALNDQLALLQGRGCAISQAKALLLGSLANAADFHPADLWFFEPPRRVLIAYSWAHCAKLVDAGVMHKARKAHDTQRAASARYSQSLLAS